MFTEDTPNATSTPETTQIPVIDAHSTGAAAPFTTNVFSVRASALGHFHYSVAIALSSSAGLAVHIDAGYPEIVANLQ
jgi:hypothetical protein